MQNKSSANPAHREECDCDCPRIPGRARIHSDYNPLLRSFPQETPSVRVLAMPDNNLGYAQGLVPPPSGVTPNFVDPVWNGIHLVVAAIVCPILTALFVAARCASKAISRGFGWDDCQYSHLLKAPVNRWWILLLTTSSCADQIAPLSHWYVEDPSKAGRLLMSPAVLYRPISGQYHS